MTEVGKPELGYNDILIKIKENRDLWYGRSYLQLGRMVTKTIPVPMVVGHEYVGEVVGIGEGVRGLSWAIAFLAKVTLLVVTAVTVVAAVLTFVVTRLVLA